MDWPPDPDTWPLAKHSRLVAVAPHRWHVQEMGQGPELLLLHGAGGAVHSWRGLMPLLADHYRVIAVDLPGHGFTRSPHAARSSLDSMGQDLEKLIASEGWQPAAVIGHSAGGALALRLSQSLVQTPLVIGLNPALTPFDGVAGWLFPMLAKMLAVNPLTPFLFTLGNPGTRQARKLILGTGSELDQDGYRLYAGLIGDRKHVNGALQMMARWDLKHLLRGLPTIEARTLFITGINDKAVAASVSDKAAARMPNARVVHLEGTGHLVHEEDPTAVADEIKSFLQDMAP
jgi:magnesium chelatase accessory protein